MIPENVFIFGPSRDEIKKDGWSLNDGKLNDLCWSQYFSCDQMKKKVFGSECSTHNVPVFCIQILEENWKNLPFETTLCRR